MQGLPLRILIDCTVAAQSGSRTGVPRVVWSLIREVSNGPTACGVEGIDCCSTIFHDGQFFRYDSSQLSKSLRMRADILSFATRGYRLLATALSKVIASKSFRQWLLPDAGHLGIFRPLLKKQVKKEQRLRQADSDWKKPGAGDILLLPDAYWSRPAIWPAVVEARKNGAMIVSLIYDLIPLTHPHFVSAANCDLFVEYFQKATENSDLLVAISDTIRDECRAEISKRWPGVLSPEKIRSFHLGADLPKSEGNISPTVAQLFSPTSSRTPYLMVSTFDPRKNHQYLIDTFELFWKTHPDAALCLIGGRGWMSNDLLQLIEQHERFGKQLFKFHSMADAELQYCYQNARGVICPSHVEGFGLPIVEALAFGRKAFLNDTRIHREIGKEDCEYFDCTIDDSLLKLLTKWESLLESGHPVEQACRRPTSWQEATKDLMTQCINAYTNQEQVQGTRRADCYVSETGKVA